MLYNDCLYCTLMQIKADPEPSDTPPDWLADRNFPRYFRAQVHLPPTTPPIIAVRIPRRGGLGRLVPDLKLVRWRQNLESAKGLRV